MDKIEIKAFVDRIKSQLIMNPVIVHGTGQSAKKLIKIYSDSGKFKNIKFVTDNYNKDSIDSFHGIPFIDVVTANKEKLKKIICSHRSNEIIGQYQNSEISLLTLLRSPYENFFEADSNSKKVFIEVLKFYNEGKKINKSEFKQYIHPFFSRDNIKFVVDAGACHGVNVSVFSDNFFNIKKILMLEPETNNYNNLLTKLNKDKSKIVELKTLKKGLWSSCITLELEVSSENSGAHKVVNVHDHQTETEKIQVITIDQIQATEEKSIDFIKMDIEGAEIEAIKGAINVLIDNKPALAICVYHFLDDLWKIPLLINRINPDYKMYLGHHSENQWETVLYCI